MLLAKSADDDAEDIVTTKKDATDGREFFRRVDGARTSPVVGQTRPSTSRATLATS